MSCVACSRRKVHCTYKQNEVDERSKAVLAWMKKKKIALEDLAIESDPEKKKPASKKGVKGGPKTPTKGKRVAKAEPVASGEEDTPKAAKTLAKPTRPSVKAAGKAALPAPIPRRSTRQSTGTCCSGCGLLAS